MLFFGGMSLWLYEIRIKIKTTREFSWR